MGAERHRRQSRVRLGFARRAAREQRQVVLVADPVEAAHRPQRLPPVEPERAESVGVGELFQRGGREAAAQPEVAHGIISLPPPLHEPAHVLLPDADDLPQTQAHRVRRADMRRHLGVAGVEAEPLSPCGRGAGVRGRRASADRFRA